ncbi:MAG: cellobiose phosphorylase, partial [Oscillospiraceae bacterium]|nr:cellobiose phosphorylase [Oscillospiraceae bacterium]
MEQIKFLDENGTFMLHRPENVSGLYFPLASETGLKSAVSPNLGGDAKLDQETFLLEPVSIEELHASRATRNIWCRVDGSGLWSVTGVSAGQERVKFSPAQDDSQVTAGLMRHTLERTSRTFQLTAAVTSFVPQNRNVEILLVSIENRGACSRELSVYGAIPIYGRSAANLRDHRNVTSMLHRIRTTEHGVLVKPTMSFDERGHRRNETVYYVLGCTGSGGAPEAFYPTVEEWIGEGGTYTHPRAVCEGRPGRSAGCEAAGREAMGAFRFAPVTLEPGQRAEYILLLGAETSEEAVLETFQACNTAVKVKEALAAAEAYWQERVNVRYHTGNPDFDRWMRWVSFQPFLRRLYGCSFLPHHDYGRGGRGWRDLWQDCLSLLLMDPGGVGEMIKANFGGVRVDGTNATIIGAGDGNFIADRNGIARVWMDHALWPLMTVKLYIDQTGDLDILQETAPYFKDPQTMRGTQSDQLWNEEYGSRQRTRAGTVYTGSILEHLLIQHLTAFYEAGPHNIFRLRGADWNDALDMASEYGESVAFTCGYAGNLLDLAGLLRQLAGRQDEARLLAELQELLEDGPEVYEDVPHKTAVLERYARRCIHEVSGQTITVSLAALAENLEGKAHWLMEHIRRQEWIRDGESGWFNSYYDNHGRPAEGIQPDGSVRMMLTGQVFAIMSGTATEEQTKAITRSADRYLYQKEIGGYRLNTDFHELKMDMGRMFGFAYGEKENGAVFSHMTVMYANALYRRGFVREGYKAL